MIYPATYVTAREKMHRERFDNPTAFANLVLKQSSYTKLVVTNIPELKMAVNIVPTMRVLKSLLRLINMIVKVRPNPHKIKSAFLGNSNTLFMMSVSPTNPMGSNAATLEEVKMVTRM